MLLIVLLILLWGCSAHKSEQVPANIARLKNLAVIPANAKPAYQINFKRDEVYGNTKKVLIGQISHIAVDDSGRVFIADGQKKAIDVFEPDGRYLTHFGRKGRGPGEFVTLGSVQIQGQKLFVPDPNQMKFNVFSENSFGFDYTINIAGNLHDVKNLKGTFPDKYQVWNNGTFLASFLKDTLAENQDWGKAQTMDYFYRLNKKGDILPPKILEIEGERNVMVPWGGGVTDRQGNYTSIPRIAVHPKFYGKSLTAFSDNNQIYQAWSGDFLIKEYSPTGEYERAFYVLYQGVPLTKESAVRAGVPKHILKGWHSMNRPKIWPALDEMKIDNKNRLWIAAVVKNMKVYQWWVLNQKGKLLARFDWPRSKPIKVIKNGYIYTQETDTTTGISKIVRYRVTMNQYEVNHEINKEK